MNNNKLKIIMVTNHFYPCVGGVEKSAQRLGRSLIMQGVDLQLLTPRLRGYQYSEIIDGIKVQRFNIIRCPHTRYDFWSKFVYALRMSKYLIKNRHKFYIIHVHQALYAAFVCTIISKVIRKKVIIKVAGSGVNGNIRSLKHFFWGGFVMLWVIKHADIFITLNSEMTRELLSEGIESRKIRQIPNGINFSELKLFTTKNEVQKKLLLNQHNFIGIFSGRLGNEKSPQILLRAWEKIVRLDPSAMLLIAGDGPDYASLQAFAQKLEISKHVRFLGFVHDLGTYLLASDVFVLPSNSEGMSNALLEAMALELPCVVSKVGGNLDIVKDGVNGLLFSLDDIDELVSKIEFLRNNKDIAKNIGLEGKKYIRENCDIEKVTSAYIELYRSLLSTNAHRNN